jgi:hypothetical protein
VVQPSEAFQRDHSVEMGGIGRAIMSLGSQLPAVHHRNVSRTASSLGRYGLDVVGSGGEADDVGGVARFLVSEVLLQEMQGSHTRLWGGISMGERAWRYGSDDLGPEPEKGRKTSGSQPVSPQGGKQHRSQ